MSIGVDGIKWPSKIVTYTASVAPMRPPEASTIVAYVLTSEVDVDNPQVVVAYTITDNLGSPKVTSRTQPELKLSGLSTGNGITLRSKDCEVIEYDVVEKVQRCSFQFASAILIARLISHCRNSNVPN